MQRIGLEQVRSHQSLGSMHTPRCSKAAASYSTVATYPRKYCEYLVAIWSLCNWLVAAPATFRPEALFVVCLALLNFSTELLVTDGLFWRPIFFFFRSVFFSLPSFRTVSWRVIHGFASEKTHWPTFLNHGLLLRSPYYTYMFKIFT